MFSHLDGKPTVAPALLWTLKLLAIAVIGFEVIYLVLGNLLLWVGLRPILASTVPNKVAIDFSSGVTYFPGTVILKNLKMSGEDELQGIQWGVESDKVYAHLELGYLLDHVVHLSRAEGANVRFRLRTRIMPSEADSKLTRALPPIPRFSDPPIQSAGAPVAVDEDAKWFVDIRSLDADVHEIWVEQGRFLGNAHVQGGFSLRPHHAVQVEPSAFEIREGEVRIAEIVAARGLSGTVAVRIEGFDLPPVSGDAVLERTTGSIDLVAQLPGVSFLSLFDLPVALADGSSALRVTAAMAHGVLAEGSNLAWTTDNLGVGAQGMGLTVGAAVKLDVERGKSQFSHVRATLDVPSLRFARTESQATPLFSDRIHVEAETLTADMTNPGFGGMMVDVPSIRAVDLRLLAPEPGLVPLAILGGSAEVAAHFAFDGDLHGGGLVRANLKKARLHMQSSTIAADLKISAEIRGIDPQKKSATMPRFTLEAEKVSMLGDKGEKASVSGKVEVSHASIAMGDDVEGEATVRVSGGDVAEILDYVGLRGPLQIIPNLFNTHTFSAEAAIRQRGGALDMNLTKLECGAISADGQMRMAGGRRAGGITVHAGLITAGVGIRNSDIGVTLSPGDEWLAEQLAPLGVKPAKRAASH